MARHHASTKPWREPVRNGAMTFDLPREISDAYGMLRKATVVGDSVDRALAACPAHKHPALVMAYVGRNPDREIIRLLFEKIDLHALVAFAGVSAVQSIAARYRLAR